MPHLLAAYHNVYKSLSESDSLTGFYPGVDIRSTDGSFSAELDYVELRGGDLIIGECKVSAKGFGSDEADKLLELADRLRPTGVVVATLTGSLADSARAQLDSGFIGEVVVLNSTDIFDKDPWATKESTPVQYVDKTVKWLEFPVEDMG